MADRLTPEQRHKNMQHVRDKDSEIELLLRKELWRRGLRYRKNVRAIAGCPDIAFRSLRSAIFGGSEFWHGFDCENRKNDIKSNRDFWIKKIERISIRDENINAALLEDSGVVLLFWGKETKKNLSDCADVIEQYVEERKNAL